MNTQDHAALLLEKIAGELPLSEAERADVKLDENNEFFLTLEDRIVVMFYLDEDINAFILNLPLGSLPQDETREEVMLELLCGNYSWNLTEGGTLGVDRATGIISLSYLVSLPLAEPEQMPRIIEKLAAVADHWMRTLKEISGADETLPEGDLSVNLIRA